MVKLRKKQLDTGEFSLYLDIVHDGKRRYEFLKMYLGDNKIINKETLTIAESIRSRRQIELSADDYSITTSFKKNIDFMHYVQKVTNEKPKNIKPYYNTSKHLKDFVGRDKIKFKHIDEHWLKKFQGYLINMLATNSVVTYMNVLKAILNRAVREKLIIINPFTYFKILKEERVHIEHLTINEIQALADTENSNNEIKRYFLFACYTGLRISDIKNLKWENIKGSSIEYRQKKTNEVNYIPLSHVALQQLYIDEKILNLPENYVFKLPGEVTINTNLKRWAKKAGVNKRITTHVARHTFATISLTYGSDLYTVSKLLGHTDIKHTQRYAKVIDSLKEKAVHSIPSIRIS